MDTADLYLTGRPRTGKRVSADPFGADPELIVHQHGRIVAYCASEGDLAAWRSLSTSVRHRRVGFAERWALSLLAG